MKILKSTNGSEALLVGWVIKLAEGFYKVFEVNESRAVCLPLNSVAKKVFDSKEQERSWVSGASGVVSISRKAAVDVYGTHRNNLEKRK